MPTANLQNLEGGLSYQFRTMLTPLLCALGKALVLGGQRQNTQNRSDQPPQSHLISAIEIGMSCHRHGLMTLPKLSHTYIQQQHHVCLHCSPQIYKFLWDKTTFGLTHHGLQRQRETEDWSRFSLGFSCRQKALKQYDFFFEHRWSFVAVQICEQWHLPLP